MGAAFVFIIVLCGVVIPFAIWASIRVISVFTPIDPGASHSEVITYLLAGLTISVAMLALVIAGLAIWGYHAIKVEARSVAVSSSKIAAKRAFHAKDIQASLRAETRVMIEQEFAKWREGVAFATSQPIMDQGEQNEKVGKPFKSRKKGGQDDAADGEQH